MTSEPGSRWLDVSVLAVLAAGVWIVLWLRGDFLPSEGYGAGLLPRIALGLALTVVVGAIALFVLRRRLFDLPLIQQGDEEARQLHDAQWLIHLRWFAAMIVLGLILCAEPGSQGLLLAWWSGLVVANIGFGAVLRRRRGYETQILVQSAIDLVFLTGFLNAAGGLENPLYTMFVFHVIVGRILLPASKAPVVTALAMALFTFMAAGEYLRLLPHYTNAFFPHEGSPTLLTSPVEALAHGGAEHAAFDLYFVLGQTLPFLVVMLLADFFLAIVMRHLRGSERGLEQAAQAAVQDQERIEGVVDAAGVGMMQVDAGIALGWFSGRLAEWFNWSGTEIGSLCPLSSGTDACQICVARETFETGRPATAERHQFAGGHGERFFRHTSSPIKSEAGSVVQVVEVIEEITAQRALEAEAIRTGKLSVLGRMAAGIAHEIGNPLSSISTRLSRLERQGDAAFVSQSVDVLREQIERISRIVHGVSNFARVQRKDRTDWEVNPMVTEMVNVVALDHGARAVHIERNLEEPSALVCGVRDQIGQILLNLLLNAVEAMPEGGTVHVGSSCRDGQVRIWVEDEGPGIDEAAREHLFEPFYTTKPDGTGLGLSISAGLATNHGGWIEAENGLGGGARFVLVLPEKVPDGHYG